MRRDDIGDNFDPIDLSEVRSRGLSDSLRDVIAMRRRVSRRRLSPSIRAALAASDRNTRALIERERLIDHPIQTCIE
jgi:hypothetical protein